MTGIIRHRVIRLFVLVAQGRLPLAWARRLARHIRSEVRE